MVGELACVRHRQLQTLAVQSSQFAGERSNALVSPGVRGTAWRGQVLLTDALALQPGHAEALALRAAARVATAQYEAAASDASAALAKVRAGGGGVL